jgi:hypothetical protein
MLVKSANLHLNYANFVQQWAVKNKKSLIEELPEELKFDQTIDGDTTAKKYGKFQAYTLFIQILFGSLVFITSLVGVQFYIK